MPNILIRDLSQEAVDHIDAAAANLGLSRNECLRRRLEEGAIGRHAGGHRGRLATVVGGLCRSGRPRGDGDRVAVTSWLIDRSAYVRLQLDQVPNRDRWNTRIARGLVRLSTITRLELGFSARSGESACRQFAAPPLSLMPVEYLSPAIEDRALEVQFLLADRGQHRAPSIPDLLIAATAEKTGLSVLAADKDFTLIAAVTGQPVETVDGDGQAPGSGRANSCSEGWS